MNTKPSAKICRLKFDFVHGLTIFASLLLGGFPVKILP